MASAVYVCHHYLITTGCIVPQPPIQIWTYEDSSINVERAEVKSLIYKVHKHIYIIHICLFAKTHIHTCTYMIYVSFTLYWLSEQLESHFVVKCSCTDKLCNPNVIFFPLFLIFLVLYCVNKLSGSDS